MIGIDGNEANVDQRVGSNVYAFEILKGLYEQDEDTAYQVYLKSAPRSDMPRQKKLWQYRILEPKPLWTQWRLPLDLYTQSQKPRVFFTPGHYAPRFCPVPSVISILDLSFLHFPEAFQPKVLQQLKAWTYYSATQAAHILTISKSTKADIIKAYGIAPDKITVTYLGSKVTKPQAWNQQARVQLLADYNIPTKYFLFIGTRQPKKNLDRLITAFKKLQAQERNVSLVIVGKTWHQFTQAELDGGKNIIFTGYVPDTDLGRLLLGAEAFVFPSLYEGFGIPVLEAMSLGTLVCASNVSSIPEITGKSTLLFDPYKVDSIEASMRSVLGLSSDQKKKLIREGKIRAKQFSWDKCVRETRRVLKEYSSSGRDLKSA